ncbi:hypothetical protein K435DRAFT_602837, partial [Dendrothele bispora CBS 962.96]
NVTIDDDDPSIKYSKGWQSTGEDPFNFGGSHHFTDEPSANAVLNFSGTAVHLLCPLWPYQVGARVSLDSGAAVAVNMQDPNHNEEDGPETVNSNVLWSSGPLENDTHTLEVSFLTGMQFAALDAF